MHTHIHVHTHVHTYTHTHTKIQKRLVGKVSMGEGRGMREGTGTENN